MHQCRQSKYGQFIITNYMYFKNIENLNLDDASNDAINSVKNVATQYKETLTLDGTGNFSAPIPFSALTDFINEAVQKEFQVISNVGMRLNTSAIEGQKYADESVTSQFKAIIEEVLT